MTIRDIYLQQIGHMGREFTSSEAVPKEVKERFNQFIQKAENHKNRVNEEVLEGAI